MNRRISSLSIKVDLSSILVCAFCQGIIGSRDVRRRVTIRTTTDNDGSIRSDLPWSLKWISNGSEKRLIQVCHEAQVESATSSNQTGHRWRDSVVAKYRNDTRFLERKGIVDVLDKNMAFHRTCKKNWLRCWITSVNRFVFSDIVGWKSNLGETSILAHLIPGSHNSGSH